MNAVDLLSRLVAFDTTSARSNLELIAFIQNYLNDHGVDSQLSHNDENTKANLFATLGPPEEPGVMLSGHTDCVPVAGQPWSSDPFILTERGDDLIARGTADMKGFIACILCALPDIQSKTRQTPIHIALSYDEEVGCVGVHRLIDAIPDNVAKPKQVLVGEPTGMKVITAHKGIAAFRTTVTGRANHSSRPDLGESAVTGAARIINFLHELALELQTRAPDSTAAGFLPPYTTLNVGTVQGGIAVNVIANVCALEWEYRLLPGTDNNEIPARVAEFVRTAGIAATTETLAQAPGLIAKNSPARELALTLTGDHDTGAVSFATEAGIFQAAGMPAVVCGPGEITDAHQANEKISRDQLRAGLAFVRKACAQAL